MKKFLVIDRTGRGVKSTLSKSHIKRFWDLSELDYSDVPLRDFIEYCDDGGQWDNREVSMVCVTNNTKKGR